MKRFLRFIIILSVITAIFCLVALWAGVFGLLVAAGHIVLAFVLFLGPIIIIWAFALSGEDDSAY